MGISSALLPLGSQIPCASSRKIDDSLENQTNLKAPIKGEFLGGWWEGNRPASLTPDKPTTQ